MNPLPNTDPTLAVSYRRVSSDEQTRGFGLAVQKRRISEFAKHEGYRLAPGGDFHEDVSGAVPLADRPKLSAALAKAREVGAGVLLVADRDRLARDEFAAFDALRAFNQAGVVVLFADGYNGEGLAGNLGHLIAADDRRRTVARLVRGREEAARLHPNARKQGGRVPYGYRRVKHGLVIDDAAAEHVRAIFKLAAAGKSQSQIAKRMSESTGRPWSSSTVAGILRREVYMKKRPGRIVAPKVWHAATRSLVSRRKRKGDSYDASGSAASVYNAAS
jgi:DNA invertase Pin-like site-specific DNA recombinase